MFEICPFCERKVKIIQVDYNESRYKCSYCKKEWLNESYKNSKVKKVLSKKNI